jgi:phosphoribosylamine--glycine ligase
MKQAQHILFITQKATSIDLAKQCADEDYHVKYHIALAEEKDIGDGFVEKTNKWKTEAALADLIIFDNIPELSTEAEKLRKKGKLVISGTSYTDKLENDYAFQEQELKKLKIKNIPCYAFTKPQEAITFITKNPQAYHLKPAKNSPRDNLETIGYDQTGKDLIAILEKLAAKTKKEPLYLYKKIEGTNIRVGAYFNGTNFCTPIALMQEHKQLFPDNVGMRTESIGDVIIWTKKHILFEKLIKPFTKKLQENKFIGYFTLECTLSKEGIFASDITTSIKHQTMSLHQDSITESIGTFFFKLATGKLKTFGTKEGVHLGVSILVPPYPFHMKETHQLSSKGAEISCMEIPKGTHIREVKCEKNKWIVTGTQGHVLYITAQGKNIKEARKKVYNKISTIKIPDLYYRNDIGTTWENTQKKITIHKVPL